MIPVTPVGPPAGFSQKVVARAKQWSEDQGLDWQAPPPKRAAKDLPDLWRNCLDDLHDSYGGICAYLSVYFHRATQSTSVDHYVPKSKAPIAQAYAWENYRLASRPMNTNKGESQVVLDPFKIPPTLFQLNLLNGRVEINTAVAKIRDPLHQQAQATIRRLKLNAGPFRSLRLQYITEYVEARQLGTQQAIEQAQKRLKFQSPFIYQEILRQGW